MDRPHYRGVAESSAHGGDVLETQALVAHVDPHLATLVDDPSVFLVSRPIPPSEVDAYVGKSLT